MPLNLPSPRWMRQRRDGFQGSESPRSWSLRRRATLAALMTLGFAAVWVSSPRSTYVDIEGSVCEYDSDDFQSVAAVNCGGLASGILNRNETLTLVDDGSRRAGGPVQTIAEETGSGQLHIWKPWFGSYVYEFVAANGTVTRLEVVNAYLGGVRETLRQSAEG